MFLPPALRTPRATVGYPVPGHGPRYGSLLSGDAPLRPHATCSFPGTTTLLLAI